jgi:hypothetical protein
MKAYFDTTVLVAASVASHPQFDALRCELSAVSSAEGVARLWFHRLQTFGAVAANFRARHRHLHVKIPRDLFLQLLVQAAFEFAHLSATQTGHVNVIARAVRLVIVPVAAKVEQIQFVDQALLFEQINRAVDGDEVDARVNLLSAFQDLVHIQMLLSIVHHLQNDAALPGHADSARGHRLLKFSGCFRGIEALTGGNPVSRRCSHLRFPACAEIPSQE